MKFLLLLPLLLCGCPERATVQHGVQLTFKKEEVTSERSVIDRRLAKLKVSATLREDGSRFTIRTDQANVSTIKSLMSVKGTLQLCNEEDCFEPHVISVEPRDGQLLLVFDRSGSADLTRMTTKWIQKTMIIRLDDQVLISAVVNEPIDSGKLIIPVPPGMTPELASAVLMGGPLIGFTFEGEKGF